jgi:hypothetical protein
MIITKMDGKNKVIYKSNNLNELFRKVEELAFVFLNTFQVQPEKYFQKSKSHKWGWVPYGFFMVSRFDKVIIYKKEQLKGYIYNCDSVRKIISFSIVRPESREIPEIEKDYDLINDAVNYKINKWEIIHNTIQKKDIDDTDNTK